MKDIVDSFENSNSLAEAVINWITVSKIAKKTLAKVIEIVGERRWSRWRNLGKDAAQEGTLRSEVIKFLEENPDKSQNLKLIINDSNSKIIYGEFSQDKSTNEGDVTHGDNSPIFKGGTHNIHYGDDVEVAIAASKQKIGDGRLLGKAGIIGDPPLLVGRDAIIADIDARLHAHKILLLKGMGGMGKTAIAKTYLNECIANPEYAHLCWIEYQGTLKESMDSGITHTLSVRDTDGKKDLNATYNNILDALQQLGESSRKKNLLIIDGFDNLEDKNELFGKLEGWHVLVTSRLAILDDPDPEEEKVYNLGALSPDQAKKLFRRYHNDPGNEDGLEELLQDIGYHTMTIILIAKILDERPSIRLRRFAELREEAGDIVVTANHSIHETSLRSFLSKLFELSEINERQLNILQNLSVVPSFDFDQEHLLRWLQIDDDHHGEFITDLKDLDKTGWLLRQKGKNSAGNQTMYYRCHPLIQELILDDPQRRPTCLNCEKLIEYFRLLISREIYRATGAETNARDQHAELQNIVQSVIGPVVYSIIHTLDEPDASLLELASCLDSLLFVYLGTSAHYSETIALKIKHGQAANTRADQEDAVKKAFKYYASQEYQQALDHANKALELTTSNYYQSGDIIPILSMIGGLSSHKIDGHDEKASRRIKQAQYETINNFISSATMLYSTYACFISVLIADHKEKEAFKTLKDVMYILEFISATFSDSSVNMTNAIMLEEDFSVSGKIAYECKRYTYAKRYIDKAVYWSDRNGTTALRKSILELQAKINDALAKRRGRR